MNDYSITILTFIAIQAIVACGLNVIVGYAGQISLGHAAFFGIGAYSSALLTTKAGLTFWTALPLVILLTGAIGLVLGMPSLRLREDFLAVTTIGINFIVESVFLYVPFIGGPGQGGKRASPSRHEAPGPISCTLPRLPGRGPLYIPAVHKEVGGPCLLRPPGGGDGGLQHGGLPHPLQTAGLRSRDGHGGTRRRPLRPPMRCITATDYGLTPSVTMMALVVLGGIGTLWGPVLGALILGVLPEVFRPLIDYRMLLNAAILLLMIRFQPAGLLGEGSLLRRLFRPGRDSAHE